MKFIFLMFKKYLFNYLLLNIKFLLNYLLFIDLLILKKLILIFHFFFKIINNK